jgi:hypothetical protein
MTTPSYVQPFVLAAAAADRSRRGNLDAYRSPAPDGEPRPVIVFVHGGPKPAAIRPTPRDWPVYVGYASLAANRGMIGVMAGHCLHSPADYPLAAADIASAVEQARTLPDADPDRSPTWKGEDMSRRPGD